MNLLIELAVWDRFKQEFRNLDLAFRQRKYGANVLPLPFHTDIVLFD
jgi:hypothetical protein